jgi:hypothetical protein
MSGSAAPPDDIVEQLAARVARVEADTGQATQTLADEKNRLQQTMDRSWIAKMIIYVFVGAVGVVLILMAVQGYASGNWATVSGTAGDLVKSTILPVVTLVLGYYFGQSDRK